MRPNLSRILGVVAGAIAMSSCATPPGPPAPSARGGPPAARGYIDVGLAAQAAPFEAYTRRAAAIDPSFSGPAEIAADLTTAAGYEPRQLEASMIAYGALAALQEPGFVEAVRHADRRDLARRLAADPDAALSLPSASAAAGRANAALTRRGEALAGAGQRVRKAAYAVQRQAWSKAKIPNAAARLAAVKRAAAYRAEPADRAEVAAAVTEAGRRSGNSPVVARSLAVAALTVAGQDSAARSLMSEPRSAQCLRWAKLNYHQCLAAAGTHYEDIYCLGLHAMADPGQCVVEATRATRSVRRASLD
ncbi:MAG: hypothetical protein GC203_10220 [Phenylobacterium sp.]|uniref:hypothetical protein n=1 Tax=Phenylobacterium sp. TaxID=1871053 RepID=UPI0025E5127A|nr:hypothetical protein [Phenylobacterium sp.]MBI1198226.1 hypothetical protein [Phenylobacterium sp.]